MSSDSTMTVPNLAMEPKKLSKNVKNAIWPVDLFLKFVRIWGTLAIMLSKELLLEMRVQSSGVIMLVLNIV